MTPWDMKRKIETAFVLADRYGFELREDPGSHAYPYGPIYLFARADNAKSEPTARLFAQVGSTDGLCGNGTEVGAGDTAAGMEPARDIHAELTLAAFHREVAK